MAEVVMYKAVLLWVLILDIWVFVKAAYDVSNTYTTWTEAANQCELLAEPVQYTASGNAFNLESNPVFGEEGAWVGYYMTWTAFEYIGCVSRTALSKNRTLETVDDPGQCYSACNFSEYFGLFFNECFCLDYQIVESVKDKRKLCFQCSSKYFGSQGPACGSETYDNMALYKVNDAVLRDSSIMERGSQKRDELCLEYSPGTGSFIWGACNRALQVMCQTDEGVEILKEGGATWITAMIMCMNNGSDPTTFVSSSSVTSAKNLNIWTGVVRARVIHNHILEPIDTRNGKKWFGYITKQGRYWLNFTEELVQKPFICDRVYDVSNTYATWTEAANQCKLLAEPVQYTASGNALNLESNPVFGEEGAWVGYYMAWTAFEYIGCVSRSALSEDRTLETVDNPGQCYSACNFSEYFGLVSNECFCLDYQSVESIKDKRRFCLQCSSKFFGSQGPACGSVTYDNMALYKVNDAVLRDSSISERGSQERDELCLEYSPGTGSFIWATCNRALQVMCQTDEGVETLNEGGAFATWISAMIKCMRNGSDPTTFVSSSSVTSTSNAGLWTGVVRVRVIHSHILDPIDTRTGKKWFGYITKQGRYSLNFTEELVQKQFICDRVKYETSSLATQTGSSTTYASTTTGSDNSNGESSTTYSTATTGSDNSQKESSTTYVTTTPSDNSDKVPETEGLTVPVYVVVIVVVALLALLAAIVFILIWKSRNAKRKSQNTEMTPEQNGYIQPVSQHYTEVNPQYEHLKQVSPQPAYSHLTPTITGMEQTRRTNFPLQVQGRVQNRHTDYLNPVCDGNEDEVYTTIPDTAIGDKEQHAVDSDYEKPNSSVTQVKRLY
ncbi:uncharacterized protein LOC123561668 isoform X3 [Mercenaria mercenaria]|uniref:uncharacterized protein LOC123561668 isoform X3 n=1 Tax=Mercenaria mercenaria TaxID=6596 RepID=UPI00234EF2D2|nr:uncharacterized protein LOC123561668 isoform X3 [Mercenaria mercenaria]